MKTFESSIRWHFVDQHRFTLVDGQQRAENVHEEEEEEE